MRIVHMDEVAVAHAPHRHFAELLGLHYLSQGKYLFPNLLQERRTRNTLSEFKRKGKTAQRENQTDFL